MPDDRSELGFATRAIHGQALPPVDQDTPSVPIFQTSTFRFDSSADLAETIEFRRPGYTYTRGYGNPTLLAFERVMADLEGTESAHSFASGMAAVHTLVTSVVTAGDRVVASNELYGGTYALFATVLPRYGVAVEFVDPHDLDAVRAALPGAKLLYVETIANPNVTVADLPALGALAAEAGVASAVDNTFASPYLCTPARYGFDYVLHSATKYIGGHNDLIGGVVCTSEERMAELRSTVIETGATMAPLEAWLSMRGLTTLEIRMRRHGETASALAGLARVASQGRTDALPGSRVASASGGRRRDPASRVWGHGRVRGRRRRGGGTTGAATRSSSPGWGRASGVPTRSCATRPRPPTGRWTRIAGAPPGSRTDSSD